MAQTINNLLAMQETWVRFLGREDPLEKGMATLCGILAWRIPWTEEPGGLWSMTEQLTLSHSSLVEKPDTTVVSESSKGFFFFLNLFLFGCPGSSLLHLVFL